MGRALLRLARDDSRFVVVAGVSLSGEPIDGVSVSMFAAGDMARCPAYDVAIDFSLPEGFDAVLAESVRRGSGLVSGTTGLSEQQRTMLANAGQHIALVWASNFSIGVVVLAGLVRRAAATLKQWQIDITETHHVHKKDAPSGTALTLAQAAQAARGAAPAIRSLREGEVIGEHVVRFSGPGEILELTHTAVDRDIFARGALEAADRLRRCPAGIWSLDALILRDQEPG
jgi:4-hydroxy-tetrahydrodipicolinate reductase